MHSFARWPTASKQKPKDLNGASFFHAGELHYN
jgi:hypothetical protein